jgi:hemerythrin
MTLLTFKPEYSVGIDSMDEEHRQLIRLINELYEEMKERKDRDSIEQFLGDIHAAVSAHFALEVSKAGFEEFDAHKEDHEELLDQIRDMMDVFDQDSERGMFVLRERLSDWFASHFATFDARLHGKLPH